MYFMAFYVLMVHWYTYIQCGFSCGNLYTIYLRYISNFANINGIVLHLCFPLLLNAVWVLIYLTSQFLGESRAELHSNHAGSSLHSRRQGSYECFSKSVLMFLNSTFNVLIFASVLASSLLAPLFLLGRHPAENKQVFL